MTWLGVRVPTVLVEERQFRALLLSQVLSIIGDRVMMVVLPFVVLSNGGDVRDVALVAIAQFVPVLVLSLPAGVVADRFSRKTLLIATDLVRCACQLAAAVLHFSGDAGVALLVVVAVVHGTAGALFGPAFSGLLPTTVSPRNLQAANSMRGLAFSSGSIAGPMLAGLVVGTSGGAGAALCLDAATFAVSSALLVSLQPAGSPSQSSLRSARGTFAAFREGWGEVRSRPWVMAFLGGSAAYHVAVLPAVFVVGPVVMMDHAQGARSWAIVIACFGAGSVVGDLLLLRWRPRRAMGTATLMLAGASCQAAIIGSGLGVWSIGALEFVAGIFVAGAFTLWETALAENVQPSSLSRVFSYDHVTSAGLIPVGNLAVGLMTEAIGVHSMLTSMSVIGVSAALAAFAVPQVRSLTRGPDRSGAMHGVT